MGIENILKAREEEEGGFKSLADFCCRVDLRSVNKRALETLIYAGAFDALNANRQQLINDLVSDNNGETTESKNDFQQAPSTSPVEAYSLQDKLRLEKEHLGFYVSEHPLTALKKAAKLLSPINLNEI